jgi:hypothetical protein
MSIMLVVIATMLHSRLVCWLVVAVRQCVRTGACGAHDDAGGAVQELTGNVVEHLPQKIQKVMGTMLLDPKVSQTHYLFGKQNLQN